jgi:hypothetical protein
LAFCGGTVFLAYAAQRRRPWLSLGIFAFAINGYLIYGFLNYVFGLGLAFATLALWLLKRRETIWTALLFSLLPFVIMLCHLTAFGVYAVAIASFTLYSWTTSSKRIDDYWRVIREALYFLPTVLTYLFFVEHSGGPPSALGFLQLYLYYFNPVRTKLGGLLGLFYSANGLGWDLTLAAFVAAAAIFLWRRAGIKFVSRGAITATAAMFAVFVLAPFYSMGSYFLDSRLALPLLAFVFAFAGVRRESALTPKAAAIMMAGLFAIVLQRSVLTAEGWRSASETYTQVRNAMARMEEGSRVATIVRKQGFGPEVPPIQNIASFAVIDRLAFIPNLYAFPMAQDPVEFKGEFVDDVWNFRSLVLQNASDVPDWTRLAERFDYVLFFDGGHFEMVPPSFRRVASGTGFFLLSTQRPNLAAPP